MNLSSAVSEYLTHQRARSLSKSTIDQRASAMGLFLRVVGDKPVARVTPADLDKVFTRYPWSQGTINNRIAIYRSFFEWCRGRGYAPRSVDPMTGWRSVRVAEADRLRIPRSEWATLFDACRNTSESVIVALGLYQFLRVSEMREIQLKHVYLSEGEIRIHRVKTRERDVMPIPVELDAHLRAHLTWYSKVVQLDPEFYLLPGYMKPAERDLKGHFVEGSGLLIPTRPLHDPRRSVKLVLKRAGYPTAREGGHTLRRSGARAYFDYLTEQGYDGALRRVQTMLGHKDSKMTETYLGGNLDQHRRNQALKGKRMFPETDMTNVRPITPAMSREGML